jgi:hypothetical protein
MPRSLMRMLVVVLNLRLGRLPQSFAQLTVNFAKHLCGRR